VEQTLELTHVPATTDAETIAALMAQAGAVVIDELITPELIDSVLTELDPYLAATEAGPDEFSGLNTRRTGSLIARSPASRAVIAHPLVLDVVGRVLAHATTFQLHLTQMISIGPGEPAQPVHRDQWAYDFFTFPTGYEVQVSTMWAMTDFTEENGATRVVPGATSRPIVCATRTTTPSAPRCAPVRLCSIPVPRITAAARTTPTRCALA